MNIDYCTPQPQWHKEDSFDSEDMAELRMDNQGSEVEKNPAPFLNPDLQKVKIWKDSKTCVHL